MIFGDARRSENIEDRRRRRVAPEISQGVFSAGQPVPNVFDTSEGLLTGLGPDDFANEPIGPLSREAGVEDVARRPAPPTPTEPARWAMGALAAQDQYKPEEGSFQAGIRATPWFSEFKQKYGEEPNLNDPNYDYRAAWKAGARPEVRDPGDQLLHWPSRFKGENHPNRYVDGVDTRGMGKILAPDRYR